jgi:GNAT superfamily N-acetyltransferase
MLAVQIEPLQKSHIREHFNCGHAELNRYLQQQARQDAQNQVAAVFVAVTPPDTRVLGFYCLSASNIPVAELPVGMAKKLPRYPLLPVTLLGRLALDESCKGQGLGQFLLLDALYKSAQAANTIAAMAVVVDAMDASAAAFYQHYGFMPLNTASNKLFLPMKTVANLFS